MVVGWMLIIALGLGALYGLHRLGLWMEERGYIYYLHKKPKGSALGSWSRSRGRSSRVRSM